jgi:predicted RNA-binding protein with PIN domain
MADYRGFAGTRIVIVFDGRGAQTTDERLPEGIQVFYSSASHTADDIIERLAIKYAEQYDIQVATDDRAEQNIVIGAGGSAMSVDHLIQLWERSESDRERWLDRHRRS